MMSLLLSPVLSSVLVLVLHQATAQAALQGIPGYLPIGYPSANPPAADLGPNDVYQHIEVTQRPEVRLGDVVLYPGFLGFDLGQDGEQHIYEVVNVYDLQHQQHLLQQQQQHQQLQQQQQQHQFHPFSSQVANDIGGAPTSDGDAHV